MIQRLSKVQFNRLHTATLEVLEETGIRMLESSAVKILKKAGCDVADGNLVRFPGKLVEWALDITPKEIILYDRLGKPTIHLSGKTAYYGNGSDLLYILDHETEIRRKAVLQDVRDIMSVLDVLPGIDFVMSGFLPSDTPVSRAEIAQMMIMLTMTNKPIVFVTTGLENTQICVEMAQIMAGSPKALNTKPSIVHYINISNPLRHNPESIKKLMWLSEKNLPFIYRPSIVTRGISTPVTWAGFLVVNNAAGLAGLVLSQLVREGAPFIRCGCSGGTFDMHSMVGLHAAPELRGFNEDMAEYYRMPRFGIGGLCGSKCVDQQAAYEAALTLLTSTQSGAQLIHDVGYMDNGTTGSLEQLVICHEIIGWVKQYMKELRVDEETIALDVINNTAGRGEDFLGTNHTVMHYKEDYYPDLTERETFDSWNSKGGLTLQERAKRKVDRILKRYKLPALKESVLSRLNSIAARI